jgi:hypothetical protein
MGEQAAVISVVDPAHPVNYSKNETPPNYKCGKCGATGCKLWRDYQTFLEHQSLLCVKCAGQEQEKVVYDIDDAGKISLERMWRTDQIGWMVPAVPTEENDAYWGYSSIPQAGCEWWYHLPSLSEQTKAELKQLAHLVIEHAKLKQRRGRKPSMTFWGQRNPQKALTLALKYAS